MRRLCLAFLLLCLPISAQAGITVADLNGDKIPEKIKAEQSYVSVYDQKRKDVIFSYPQARYGGHMFEDLEKSWPGKEIVVWSIVENGRIRGLYYRWLPSAGKYSWYGEALLDCNLSEAPEKLKKTDPKTGRCAKAIVATEKYLSALRKNDKATMSGLLASESERDKWGGILIFDPVEQKTWIKKAFYLPGPEHFGDAVFEARTLVSWRLPPKGEFRAKDLFYPLTPELSAYVTRDNKIAYFCAIYGE